MLTKRLNEIIWIIIIAIILGLAFAVIYIYQPQTDDFVPPELPEMQFLRELREADPAVVGWYPSDDGSKKVVMLSRWPEKGVKLPSGYAASEFKFEVVGEISLIPPVSFTGAASSEPPTYEEKVDILWREAYKAGWDLGVPVPTGIPPTAVPPTSTPVPYNKIIQMGTSGGTQYIGWCTQSFWGTYNIPGHALYGKRFLITNAHCVTKPGAGATYDESGGEWISPALGKDGKFPDDLLGVTSFWWPRSPKNMQTFQYDSGAVLVNDNIKLENIIPGLGKIDGVIGLNNLRVYDVVEKVGATSGYTQSKIQSFDACIAIVIGGTKDAPKYIGFCDQIVIKGLKPCDKCEQYPAMKPGDSGSAFFIKKDGKLLLVGQGFAGSYDGKIGIVSPQAFILKGLHIDLVLEK